MKEKLKKVFTNKEFWTALIGCIGLFLSIALSYFTGLKDGILMDNSVRTELIEKTLDESKINKKQAFTPSDKFEYVAIPQTNVNNVFFFDIEYIFNNIIELDSILDIANIVSNNDLLFSYDYSFNGINYTNSIIFNISKSSEYTSVGFKVKVLKDNAFHTSYSISSLKYSTDTQAYTSGSSLYLGTPLTLSSFTYNSNNYSNTLALFDYGIGLFELSNTGGATQEELEQAYQNGFDKGKSEGKSEGYDEGYQDGLDNSFTEDDIYNSYLNGFDKGKSEGRIEGYNEGIKVGKEIGYQDRIDSVEDTEHKINSVWTILENAITSVLNVLSFEILPGIPLYICIGVPILLAVLLWFIKMGQS